MQPATALLFLWLLVDRDGNAGTGGALSTSCSCSGIDLGGPLVYIDRQFYRCGAFLIFSDSRSYPLRGFSCRVLRETSIDEVVELDRYYTATDQVMHVVADVA